MVWKTVEAFKVAADELKADLDFTLAAATKNWQIIEFAAEELKADCDIIWAALAD